MFIRVFIFKRKTTKQFLQNWASFEIYTKLTFTSQATSIILCKSQRCKRIFQGGSEITWKSLTGNFGFLLYFLRTRTTNIIGKHELLTHLIFQYYEICNKKLTICNFIHLVSFNFTEKSMLCEVERVFAIINSETETYVSMCTTFHSVQVPLGLPEWAGFQLRVT